MKVYCAHALGVVLDLPAFPGQSVTLNYGENDVPDDFGEAWFAYHDDPAHRFPLITDGVIYRMADEPKPDAEEAPADAEKAPVEPEPEPEPAPAEEHKDDE